MMLIMMIIIIMIVIMIVIVIVIMIANYDNVVDFLLVSSAVTLSWANGAIYQSGKWNRTYMGVFEIKCKFI